MATIRETITLLYVGYLNRAADPEGLQYWIGRANAGMAIAEIAQSFSVQPETAALYGPLTAAALAFNAAAQENFLNSVYANLFGRSEIDAAGMNYWKAQLNSGEPIGRIIQNIISGARGNDSLVLVNKAAAAEYFSAQTVINNVAFAADVARSAIAGVTVSMASVTAAQTSVDALLAALPKLAPPPLQETPPPPPAVLQPPPLAETPPQPEETPPLPVPSPVNNAPAGADRTVTASEDGVYIFAGSDFGFTDPLDNPANEFAGVRIAGLPGGGTGSLTLGAAAVAVNDEITRADIIAGNLKFTPAANVNGAGLGSFTFQVRDTGGTANGGVDIDATPNTLTLTVTAVNDAAAITGAASGAVDEDAGPNTVSGDLNATDIDNSADAFHIVAPGAAAINGYGTFAVTADGVWTYALDNANAGVDALNDADILADSFIVHSADGTAQLVNITITGTSAPGAGLVLNGAAGDDMLSGGAGGDTLNGFAGNDMLSGNAGSDALDGNEGGDTLNGGADGDVVNGGSGNDIFLFGTGDVSLGETLDGGSGTDTIRTTGTVDFLSLAATGILSGAAIEQILIQGGETATFNGVHLSNQTISINSTDASAAHLAISVGGAANFSNLIFAAFGGNNAFDSGVDTVTITGGGGDDTITGGTISSTLNGGAGADSISGGGGNDIIAGEQNDSLLDGGAGTDTLNVGTSFTSTGNAQIANIENVILTAAATLNLGNQTEGFTITGSLGNDTITGGSGVDSISAGGGDDIITGQQTDALLDGGAGNDTLNMAASFTSTGDGQIANTENVTLTAAVMLNLGNQTEGFSITGSSGNDTITGSSGADTITGGGGNDSVNGGGGNDTITGEQIDSLLDGGAGTDTLKTDSSFTSTGNGQIANIENVALTAAVTLNLINQTEAFTITGSSGDDTITGGAGIDSINSGGGNDAITGQQNDSLLDGGAGTDTLKVGASFSSAGDGQIANIENVTLTSAVTLNLGNQTEGFIITGSSGADAVTGGSGADSIDGGGGSDTITGQQNDSLLDGGAGTDTLTV
ncbi:MAG: VCBS domain-containing protein, partial [Alphaproteobacteria bacterium]